ncbi:MAG: LOG family protein [Elainellaceae cyanobacterium]
MTSSSSALDALRTEANELIDQLPTMRHGKMIQQALMTLVRMAEVEADSLDWKILTAAMQDMERAFRVFYPHRHTRKITIFGSARITRETGEYHMATEFARAIVERGFMVMTGAGGGIMQAGNEGATAEQSFGLNIRLPFEQGANDYIQDDPKLIDFKYFFTRKLFFLRETDALALFPGGFGTQDEAFECLTLIQTGKSDPIPLVLIDEPRRDYWRNWDSYIRENLLKAGLVSPGDPDLYMITTSIDEACEAIANFYRVYHSSRYVGDRLVLRLKCGLTDASLAFLNDTFSDLLVKGKIMQGGVLPEESEEDIADLPRLTMHFNQRDFGRLHEFIRTLNEMETEMPKSMTHPEKK